MLIKELAREIFDQLNVRHSFGADGEGVSRSEIRKSIELRIKEAIGQLALVPKDVFDAQTRELDQLKHRTLELEETVKSLEQAVVSRVGDLDEFLASDSETAISNANAKVVIEGSSQGLENS